MMQDSGCAVKLLRGDHTKNCHCPIPVTDKGEVVGQVVRVWFDGEYTVGQVEYNERKVWVAPLAS